MSGTIRSRAEAQRDRHVEVALPSRSQCRHCQYAWPCPDWVAADDTLTDLNNAREEWEDSDLFTGNVRLIPDPDSRGAA